MTDTVSISSEPRIKFFAGSRNALSNNTTSTTIKNVRTSAEEEWLWTGESVYCLCSHHVKQHSTIRDRYGCVITIQCHGSDQPCNCGLFKTRRIRRATVEDI